MRVIGFFYDNPLVIAVLLRYYFRKRT